MEFDFNHSSVASHFQAVANQHIRATAMLNAVRNTPGNVASMYATKPVWVHELPLEQVAQVAEELCDAGFSSVVSDMSENRAIRREYREVLAAVAQGEPVVY